MSRVSQEELYNDKDVVTQILKLKDTVNDYAGGIIENIDVSGNDLVIDWADGTSISLPLPSPTGISSVTGTVSGGNLTITFYMTDGSSHAFTCPLTGMATEAYVNGLDAQNVKKTGSTVTGALEVPTIPPTPTSAVNDVYVNDTTDGVNNISHKSGNEYLTGKKMFTSANPFTAPDSRITDRALNPTVNVIKEYDILNEAPGGAMRGVALVSVNINTDGTRSIRTQFISSRGGWVYSNFADDGTNTYMTTPNRITNLAQVSGVTTYDDDIVTIGVLKKLGLIS